MEIKVKTLAGEAAGTLTVSDAVFGLEPRADILQRMVRWQLAKRQAGTHKSKTRGEIKATSKKMYRQKGTGSARHGNKAAPQFRGGGKAFGPVARRKCKCKSGSGSRISPRVSSARDFGDL